MGGGAEWHGSTLTDAIALPFGWITPDKANVYDAPPEKGEKAHADRRIERAHARQHRRRAAGRQEEVAQGHRRRAAARATFGNILADNAKKAARPDAPPAARRPPRRRSRGRDVDRADAVNEVRKLDRPKTVPPRSSKWIDVDLGEQVLVAYEEDKPVFATLVSSGRAIATPRGTYPVWAKVSAITMKSQPYEDKAYFVNKVPWSPFFQAHNAIHGAYWHDRFGVTQEPRLRQRVAARRAPPLRVGDAAAAGRLDRSAPARAAQSPTVVVRNSHLKKQFRQDRPIGPPDTLEAERLEEAEERRADEAAAARPPPPPPTQTALPRCHRRRHLHLHLLLHRVPSLPAKHRQNRRDDLPAFS